MNTSLTTCAACGGPIVQPFSANHPDFCSRTCFRAGRAFCKQCTKPLPEKSRRTFCSYLCRRKYYLRQTINPSYREELKRSTCKTCGEPLSGKKKMFCSQKCNNAYHYAYEQGKSLTDTWGGYAPETRKILIELQSLDLNGTALRLAGAIDREYTLRRKKPRKQVRHVICICKTCGKEFRRVVQSNSSTDYCTPKCHPQSKILASNHRASLLTWEEVDEIRSLYREGELTVASIAKRYNVSSSAIGNVVKYRTWKPESDPRLGGKPKGNKMMITWEQVDGIRGLANSLSQTEIARKCGVSYKIVSDIIHYRTWKPENDPRRQNELLKDNNSKLA